MDKFTFKGKLRQDFKTNYQLTMENVDKSPAQAYSYWLENQVFDLTEQLRMSHELLDAAGLLEEP